MLADEPRAFAQSIVRLVRDVDRRRQLEAAARALVVDRYDWSAVARELDDALARFAQTPSRTATRHGSLVQPMPGGVAATARHS